jgi:hypothetical protein
LDWRIAAVLRPMFLPAPMMKAIGLVMVAGEGRSWVGLGGEGRVWLLKRVESVDVDGLVLVDLFI